MLLSQEVRPASFQDTFHSALKLKKGWLLMTPPVRMVWAVSPPTTSLLSLFIIFTHLTPDTAKLISGLACSVTLPDKLCNAMFHVLITRLVQIVNIMGLCQKHGLFRVSAFAWSDWGSPRKTCVACSSLWDYITPLLGDHTQFYAAKVIHVSLRGKPLN